MLLNDFIKHVVTLYDDHANFKPFIYGTVTLAIEHKHMNSRTIANIILIQVMHSFFNRSFLPVRVVLLQRLHKMIVITL